MKKTLLKICIVLVSLPISLVGYAQQSGVWGDNITWNVSEDGTLTVSGEGVIKGLYADDAPGWLAKDVKKNVKKLVFGEGITEIGCQAFSSLPNMETIVFSNTIKTIKSFAFSGNQSLISIETTNSIETIDEYAFNACSSLKYAKIGDGVKTIGEGVFCYCTSLESLILGKSVSSMGKQVFYDCANLKEMIVYARRPASAYSHSSNTIGTFITITETCTVYVPDGTDVAYFVADGWKDMKNIEIMSADQANLNNVTSNTVSTRKVLKNGKVEILSHAKKYNAEGKEL